MNRLNRYTGLFPLVTENDLRSLADDIGSNGLHQPIVLLRG